ncbi:MAG: hypothetical protein HY761_07490 [Candidatus Omnitrophica bacterium]|nr:hypothetical protein [Candidatus Omnitrophota bacterium]
MVKKIIIFCYLSFLVTTTCFAYYGDMRIFSQLQIYRSIVEADIIAIGEIQYVKSEQGHEFRLLSLVNPEIIFNDIFSPELTIKNMSNDVPGNIYILVPQDLVFLKKVDISAKAREYFLLDEARTVYEACQGWQSAILLDFSMKSLESKILKERYDISDPQELIKVVKKLCVWRGFQEKEKKITALLELLNENKDSKIYLDNIPPMLANFGVKVVEKDGKYFAETAISGLNVEQKQTGK